MKKYLLLAVAPLLLTACQKTAYQADREALLNNPLYLEIFAEQMVDTMVNLVIYEDPIIEDANKMKVIDKTKEHWLEQAAIATKAQRQGSKGGLIPMNEFVDGEVLLHDNMVHVSQAFVSSPGPNLHIYLSQIIDPRDVQFPDETAIDAGEILVPYGAQSFAITEELDDPRLYRTVVIWDNDLERLYGFAQINPGN